MSSWLVETVSRCAKDEEFLHQVLSVALIGHGFFVLVLSFVLRVPYGRYTSTKWGPQVSARFGWVLQECPAFLIPVYLWLYHGSQEHAHNFVHLLLSVMFLWHYFYRAFVYSFQIRGRPTVLITVLSAVLFCSWNGYLQGRWLSHLAPPYPIAWLRDPRFIAGFTLFWTGWYINWDSDRILCSLRKPGESGYKIPEGGLFTYVSAANYSGEIVEWIGFALATWSLAAFAFAFFVACFLGTRALQHHQWYLDKFRDAYPRNRRAVIPFLL